MTKKNIFERSQTFTRLVEWKPIEKRKVSSGTLSPRYATAVTQENLDHHESVDKENNSEQAGQKKDETAGRGPTQPLATGVAKPVPRPPTQQAPCTAEIKTIGAFPPLMRAVSWDTVGSINMRNTAPKSEEGLSFSDGSRESLFKSSGYKDFPVPPGNVQKLSKLREVIFVGFGYSRSRRFCNLMFLLRLARGFQLSWQRDGMSG